MSHFETAIETVLLHEGEFVDDPYDPGGATMYGISSHWLKTLQKQIKYLKPEYLLAIENIQQLTKEQAINLYREYFWEPHSYEQIHDQRLATKVFDFSVNAGSHAAHLCLQRAVRAVSGEHLPEDGILGEKTLQAVNQSDALMLLIAYRSETAGYYRQLKEPHFEKGWLNRAYA